MIVTISGIPVFEAVINADDEGMHRISLVDDPAVMKNFQAFDNQRKMQMFSIADEAKRLVRGIVMRADFPIYRYDEEFGEYYLIYKADTIRKMAEKYLAESRQNNVNIMHRDDSDVTGVNMVQYFIKGDGVSVEGFDDCADGSLLAEFHVVNDDVWDEIVKGTFKGFSLEGLFDFIPEKDVEGTQNIVDTLDGKFKRIFKPTSSKHMRKKSKLARAILSILAEFGNVTTDKGVLAWDGEDDIKVGDEVFIEDENGERTPAADGDYKTDEQIITVEGGKVTAVNDITPAPVPEEPAAAENMGRIATDSGELIWAGEEDLKEGDEVFVENEGELVAAPDGEYTTEDGKVIKVEDGKVASITDKEAEVAPEENPLEEQMSALKVENESLRAENESLKAEVEKLRKAPMAAPAHEEVQTTFAAKKTGDKGLDTLNRYLKAARNA